MQIQSVICVGRAKLSAWRQRFSPSTKWRMRGSLGKFSGILQPVIEPAQQNRVRIEQRLGPEIRRADAIAPRNVHPGPGNQILVLARECAARALATSARKPSMLPLRNMSYQPETCSAGTRCGRAIGSRRAHVQYSPGSVVIEPVEHIVRYAFAMKRRMRAEGQNASLRREVGPGLFELVAGFAQACAGAYLPSTSAVPSRGVEAKRSAPL